MLLHGSCNGHAKVPFARRQAIRSPDHASGSRHELATTTALFFKFSKCNLMFSDLLVQRCLRDTKCLAGCDNTSVVVAELVLNKVTLELADLVCKGGKSLYRST